MGHGFHGYVSHNQRVHVIISQGFPAAETSRESCDFNRGCNISSQDLGGVSTGVSVGDRHQMCGFNIVNGLTFHGKILTGNQQDFPSIFSRQNQPIDVGDLLAAEGEKYGIQKDPEKTSPTRRRKGRWTGVVCLASFQMCSIQLWFCSRIRSRTTRTMRSAMSTSTETLVKYMT